jgi:pimeloyl-ACP methyl ester carboxylesterase
LGGVFARALAVLRPDLVSHAISLGGPVGGNPRSQSHPWVGYLGNALLSERGTVESNRAYESALFQAPLPPTVRLTSIYSRRDAIVRWRSCIDPDPRADAIEVLGTHSGLAWNKAVYRTLGVVLASSST